MKTRFLALSVCAVFSSCGSIPTDKTGSDGFTSLLNDSDFDGWYLKIKKDDAELASRVFTIEDGVVHVFGDSFPEEISLNEGIDDTIGMMYTEKEYENFHIKFEYKWGTKKANYFKKWQYDAGIYYYVVDDKIFPTGIEYQIHYDHTKNENHTGDAIRPGGASYDWYADPETITYLHPKDGGVLTKKGRDKFWLHNAKPTENYHALNGQWNTGEIIAMSGEYVIHKLNGEVVNMVFNPAPGKGILGFQSETAEIFYRNIEIKEFTETVPVEVYLGSE